VSAVAVNVFSPFMLCMFVLLFLLARFWPWNTTTLS